MHGFICGMGMAITRLFNYNTEYFNKHDRSHKINKKPQIANHVKYRQSRANLQYSGSGKCLTLDSDILQKFNSIC
jgi:hypothetical protein